MNLFSSPALQYENAVFWCIHCGEQYLKNLFVWLESADIKWTEGDAFLNLTALVWTPPEPVVSDCGVCPLGWVQSLWPTHLTDWRKKWSSKWNEFILQCLVSSAVDRRLSSLSLVFSLSLSSFTQGCVPVWLLSVLHPDFSDPGPPQPMFAPAVLTWCVVCIFIASATFSISCLFSLWVNTILESCPLCMSSSSSFWSRRVSVVAWRYLKVAWCFLVSKLPTPTLLHQLSLPNIRFLYFISVSTYIHNSITREVYIQINNYRLRLGKDCK